MLGGPADGTSQRESFRRWYTSSLLPLARTLETELRQKLAPDARIDLRGLRALDTQGSARALKSLADAGVPIDAALRAAGFAD